MKVEKDDAESVKSQGSLGRNKIELEPQSPPASSGALPTQLGDT